jgi:hypothetical protein
MTKEPIKPEDIPSKIFVYGSMELTPRYVAHILNQAIETGIVSPPVYSIRNKETDDVFEYCFVNELTAKNLINEEPHPDKDKFIIEHWKG